MKVYELYQENPAAVRFGLRIKGLSTGTVGVLIPPLDSDFDATAHFFHADEGLNGYGHFWFSDCENEVVLDENGHPMYGDLPTLPWNT